MKIYYGLLHWRRETGMACVVSDLFRCGIMEYKAGDGHGPDMQTRM
jgi:hypothetical protein